MAVTFNTGTATPIIGVETTVVSIAPGTPLDNLSVYFVGGQGGGGGALELALYATVGGTLTRVAQARVMGTSDPSLIEWQSIGRGAGESEQVDAGGTAYTITILDLSGQIPTPPRGPVTITIAGVDQYDTAPDANFSAVLAIAPAATASLPVFAGYAQLMDVAIDQTRLPPVTVSITADCGIGSVLNTTVISVEMSGVDTDIASVFRGVVLPVATRYFVNVTNDGASAIAVTTTGVTYSVSITAGGVVALNGDVIGPSNANTVIKWDNVPLLLGAAPGFGVPADAAVPIFDMGLGVWRTFALSGDATMTDAGVVTVNPAFVNTLGGDVIGPSNANTVTKWDNVPLLLGAAPGFGAPVDAAVPIFNAGLGEWRTFALSGDATMTDAGVVTVNPAFVNTLTGNANGPSNANRFLSLLVPAANADVAIPAPQGWWFVGFSGLTAPHQVLLPAAPVAGEVVVVTDEDGSLATQTFNVNGNGKTVEGVAVFAMNAAYPGANGSIALQYDGAKWVIFADYAPNESGAVTLAGNANGPAAANTVQYFPTSTTDADVNVGAQPHPHGLIYEGLNGLTANRTVTLPAAPTSGDEIVVKDEDGSLAGFNIVINGNGKNIDGAPTYTMTLAQNGQFGSVTLLYTGTAWALV